MEQSGESRDHDCSREANLDLRGHAVIVFEAAWSGASHILAPVIEYLSDNLDGKANLYRVNVDENPDLASAYGIQQIPTILVCTDGCVVERLTGALPRKAILNSVRAVLAGDTKEERP